MHDISYTNCSLSADQAKLQNRFQFIFQAMGQLGQDPNSLIDCSDVLQIPANLKTTPHLPAGKTLDDVEGAVCPCPFLHYYNLRLRDSVMRRHSHPSLPNLVLQPGSAPCMFLLVSH